MTRAPFFALSFALVAFTSLPACSDDDGEKAEPRGTVAARGQCTKSNDCAEPTAMCVDVSGTKACSDALGADAFSKECDKDTIDQCAGFQCLIITTKNVQEKSGVCSMPCSVDADCGTAGACATLGQSVTGCLHVCTGNADCANGFVCVSQPGNASRKVCLVEPA